jgi:OOP family OmpA-OmpF porin
VVDYLVKTGLDRGRFVARGYGEKKPLESNANPKGRAKNRRVQFIILEPAASECAPTAP